MPRPSSVMQDGGAVPDATADASMEARWAMLDASVRDASSKATRSAGQGAKTEDEREETTKTEQKGAKGDRAEEKTTMAAVFDPNGETRVGEQKREGGQEK